MGKYSEFAFPKGQSDYTENRGMTLRDYFAAKAMQGMIAAAGYHRGEVDFMAESAYDCADAMLARRSK